MNLLLRIWCYVQVPETRFFSSWCCYAISTAVVGAEFIVVTVSYCKCQFVERCIKCFVSYDADDYDQVVKFVVSFVLDSICCSFGFSIQCVGQMINEWEID